MLKEALCVAGGVVAGSIATFVVSDKVKENVTETAEKLSEIVMNTEMLDAIVTQAVIEKLQERNVRYI